MQEKIRNKIIQLVNSTKDQNLLEQVYNILDNRINFSESQLFDNLTHDQKKETELSLEESKEDYSLENHEKVMKDIRNKFGWS